MSDISHTWIKGNRALGGIVVSRPAREHELFAAEELAKYFEKISGTALPVAAGIRNRKSPSIVILDVSRPSNAEFAQALPLSSLKYDGFIVKTVGEDVFIVSKEASGVIYGTYRYLSDVLGVRFLDFGTQGEDIPYSEAIEHAKVDILKNPRLSYREMQMTYDLRRIDWMAKNGFNATHIGAQKKPLHWWDPILERITPELRKRGIRLCFGHHAFQMIIPEDHYLEDHPDYFPEVDGKRGGSRGFYWALRNKDKVMKEVVYSLEEFIGRHPEIDTFDFFPSDGRAVLTREDYEAVTGDPELQRGEWEKHVRGTTPTARLGDRNRVKVYAVLCKEVGEALGKRFPDLKIAVAGYGGYVQPCQDIRLPENVVPHLAIYWRCVKHHLLDDTCVYNKQFRQIIEEWTDMYRGRDIVLLEYYSAVTNYVSLPYPCLTSMFKEWDQLIEMGITGAKVHTGRRADTHAVPYNINYLAFQAIAWRDAASMEEFLEHYCSAYFKEAWKPLYDMYILWEKGVQAAEDTQPGLGFFDRIFDEERVNACRALLDKAMQATTDPKALYRISRLMILMEYTRLALPFPRRLMDRQGLVAEGKPTDDLDRELLPHVKKMVEYERRLQELDQDIWGYIKASSFLPTEVAPQRCDLFEVLLGRIMKEDWVKNVFNPDIFEEPERNDERNDSGST